MRQTKQKESGWSSLRQMFEQTTTQNALVPVAQEPEVVKLERVDTYTPTAPYNPPIYEPEYHPQYSPTPELEEITKPKLTMLERIGAVFDAVDKRVHGYTMAEKYDIHASSDCNLRRGVHGRCHCGMYT